MLMLRGHQTLKFFSDAKTAVCIAVHTAFTVRIQCCEIEI